ncbi:hypothetical protein EIP91_005550 [Steccherinum ochraceum]|uniref:XPG-I domain-containing protein n=1 Tax=Steccherinum ochraceum TaxID=92696 RepID=A0A4R0RMV7_9APHY|nr:hypothetical protein EIP91_005550 [Steccherinum ochraceum]
MGIQGLWDLIRPAGKSRSLTNIAVVDGFEDNKSGKRGFRLGIDASIWYQHAQGSQGGVNPEERLLFFRLCGLAKQPILPLFVFDGRERPRVKRGSKLGKTGSHKLNKKMKEMLDCFGMEWREARGEAEAELAFLNKEGYIDAILTDDVDAFAFGAKMVINNSGAKLSGNRSNPALNADGKESDEHNMVYDARTLREHPNIGLTRGGIILFALLSGGDYDGGGAKGFGPNTAQALARAGFGDQLLEAAEHSQGQELQAYLAQWRENVNDELKTNSTGLLGRRSTLSLPPDFPNVEVLREMRDKGTLSISRMASFCENHFDEWGNRTRIIHRFRTLVWEGAVIQLLRRAAIEADRKERARLERETGELVHEIRVPLVPSPEDAVGTHFDFLKRTLDSAPPDPFDRISAAFVNQGPGRAGAGSSSQRATHDTNPLMMKITKTREHVSTDHILEYRVQIDPTHLVKLANSGISGKFPEPATKPQRKTQEPAPSDPLLLWVPASMMRQVHPGMVQAYETSQSAKKSKKGKGKQRATADASESDAPPSSPVKRPRPKPRPRLPDNAPGEASGSQAPRPAGVVPRPVIPLPPTFELPPVSAPPPASVPRRPSVPQVPGDLSEEDQFSLPLRPSGFMITFPDPDDPDQVVWADVDIPEMPVVPVPVSSQSRVHQDHPRSSALPLFLPSSPSPEPIPPAPLPNRQASVSAPVASQASKGKRAAARPKRPRARADDDDDGLDAYASEDAREPTDFERMMDRILGFGGASAPKQPKRAKVATQRKRARPSLDLDDTGQQQNPRSSPKRRKSTATSSAAAYERAPSNNAAASTSRVRLPSPPPSLSLQPFPFVPPLNDPSDRSVRNASVRRALPLSARDMGVISISDDDDDAFPSRIGGSSKSSSRAAAAASSSRRAPMPASSQQSRLSTGFDDDVIEISD